MEYDIIIRIGLESDSYYDEDNKKIYFYIKNNLLKTDKLKKYIKKLKLYKNCKCKLFFTTNYNWSNKITPFDINGLPMNMNIYLPVCEKTYTNEHLLRDGLIRFLEDGLIIYRSLDEYYKEPDYRIKRLFCRYIYKKKYLTL
jgi:hypothetical protein